ncbi:RnfH family protein [Neisseria leonii]|uniref:UPF0125 protein ORY91_001718 n=1 Tax=Neisseria leonii TaxID=2995413 RepID=A0A9X4EA92_9NEIS|nr:RnfH family protein [Neisseria sp. 51.81]MDD9328298.1 RnfH family protein [Neisseria sp. 51.81]
MPEIEVAYGTAERQFLRRFAVEQGTTAREAVHLSGLAAVFPAADLAAPVGIFGKAVADDTVLRAGDRVELYRPLQIDPKEARRLRAAKRAEEKTESKI